jgi:hypothetical protein
MENDLKNPRTVLGWNWPKAFGLMGAATYPAWQPKGEGAAQPAG